MSMLFAYGPQSYTNSATGIGVFWAWGTKWGLRPDHGPPRPRALPLCVEKFGESQHSREVKSLL